MPSRVGHITQLHDDGTCRIRNEITSEEWFGRLIVMSGGMICFDVLDERLTPMDGRGYDPEEGEAPASARTESGGRTRIRVGAKKGEDPTSG
jgi:hypothetical protein